MLADCELPLVRRERGTVAARSSRLSVGPDGESRLTLRQPPSALVRPDGGARAPGAGEWPFGMAVPCDPAPGLRGRCFSEGRSEARGGSAGLWQPGGMPCGRDGVTCVGDPSRGRDLASVPLLHWVLIVLLLG